MRPRRSTAASPPSRPPTPNQFALVGFLARHGRLKDAVDLCETLWADADLREKVAAACVEILCDPAAPPRRAQVRRVIGWIERARPEKPQSMIYLLGLGNLNERLGDYRKAEEMYRTGHQVNDREGYRLQQPRLADRPPGRTGQRGPRPDQQRHPGQGSAAIPGVSSTPAA